MWSSHSFRMSLRNLTAWRERCTVCLPCRAVEASAASGRVDIWATTPTVAARRAATATAATLFLTGCACELISFSFVSRCDQHHEGPPLCRHPRAHLLLLTPTIFVVRRTLPLEPALVNRPGKERWAKSRLSSPRTNHCDKKCLC